MTKLYRDAGLRRGYSSHSGRRTFANRLLAQGQSLETVQTLLGHAALDHVMPYLDPNLALLRDALDAFATQFMPALPDR